MKGKRELEKQRAKEKKKQLHNIGSTEAFPG